MGEFYAQSPTRRLSIEHDFGTWWYNRASEPHRVSWVERTGEVIAVNLRTADVEVMGGAESRDEAERLLHGWETVCGSKESLEWARLRVGGTIDDRPELTMPREAFGSGD